MEIKFEVLDKLLLSLLASDDVLSKSKQEIMSFTQTHDFNVLSDDTRQDIIGAFVITIKPAYEEITGEFLPNFLAKEDIGYGDQVN